MLSNIKRFFDLIKKPLSFGLVSLLVGAFTGFCILIYFNLTLPSIENLGEYSPPVPSQILSSDGEILLEVGKEKREIAEFEEIPDVVKDAFLAAEDDKFFEHNGVDYGGVLRALYKNIMAGKIVQGGSTITQQVAKSILLTNERSYTRKIRDFLLALKIEEKLPKEKILTLYLNQVYLGGGYYGIKAAFRGYFDKDISEATISESAMMAGLLVAPGRYSPYLRPRYARDRQMYVLKRMLDTSKITQEQHQDAQAETLVLRIRKRQKMKGGHFTDWVRQRVVAMVGEESFLTDGFRVVTTINWPLQRIAEQQVKKGLKEIDRRQGFNGPLDSLNQFEEKTVEEEGQQKQVKVDLWDQFDRKMRQELFKKSSHFFSLTPEGDKIYEIDQSMDNYDESLIIFQELKNEYKSAYFWPGIVEKDLVYPLLKVDEMYKARITKIRDDQRIVYVSVAGVPGIIDYDGFKWAHERSIDAKKNFFPYITRPSSILKVGDVINVSLKKKSVRVTKHFFNTFLPKIKKRKELLKAISKQKFLLCELDQSPQVEGALVALKSQSGEILSFVGGKEFSKSQFNRAIQSVRQPGSAFKALLYAAGLEKGHTPSTVLMDAPEALAGVDDELRWKPRNYDGKFLGPITYRTSLEKSRNVPSIKLAEHITVDSLFEFLNRIGFNAKMESDLSTALGSFGVTLIDLVSAYALFPNGGKKVHPKSIVSIEDRTGKQYPVEDLEPKFFRDYSKENQGNSPELIEQIVEEKKEEGTGEIAEAENDSFVNPFLEGLDDAQVYDPRLSFIMSNLLKGVIQSPGGTGGRARSVSSFVGGKTGTTNNYVDAWFLGFSPLVTTGVWTGFDDNTTLGWGETGSKAALPIWKGYMAKAIKSLGDVDFSVPKGIVNVLIDRETGQLPRSTSKDKFMEAFVEGTEPGAEKVMLTKKEDEKEEEKNDLLEDDDYYNFQ